MPDLVTPEVGLNLLDGEAADEAARAMLRGWQHGLFEIHFPRRFSNFLKILRWLPDRLYFALVWRATQGDLKK